MKRVNFYIIVSFLILLLLIGIYLYYSRNNRINNNQGTQPTPTMIIDDRGPIAMPTLTVDEIRQLESDRETGLWTQELYTSYPWYDKLPLMNDKYYVYFDINQKKFIATIYLPEEEKEIKNEIQNQLSDLGIDYKQYEIVWEIR